MKQFKELDPVLHQQLRLAIVALLAHVKEAEFSYIKEQTEATSGNISVQLTKLKEAGYIKIEKSFKDNYPLTTCSLTPAGRKAFTNYAEALQAYLKQTK
jgi:DNA-binding MarR family transcriptional regulator